MKAASRKWATVRGAAMAFPGAWEDFPWGETVVKVNKKVFVFLGTADAEEPGMTVKLTTSHSHALSVAGAAPAGYGLGKAGWVNVPLEPVDAELLSDWVEESFRNVAPKKLITELDRPGSG